MWNENENDQKNNGNGQKMTCLLKNLVKIWGSHNAPTLDLCNYWDGDESFRN